MNAPTLKVNPSILSWARTERGYNLNQAAEKLGKDIDKVREWENSGENISFPELKKIAKTYKRQLSVFFLEETPKETKLPKDRRNLKVQEHNLSVGTMLAVRRTNRYLKLVRELSDKEEVEQQYTWLAKVNRSNNLSGVAPAVRNWLGVSVNDQRKLYDSHQALRLWRERIESKLGIYTFQFPIPDNELDGFSYIEEGVPYAITLNSKNTNNRKIFTLFHELGHILEGSSGICLTMPANAPNVAERRCDSFAAEVLLPKEYIKKPYDFDELKILAKEMKVSAEVYARRAYDQKIINKEKRDSFIRQIRQAKLPTSGHDDMRIPPLVLSKSQRGESFFNLIIDAYDRGKINGSDVADILRVRPTRIDRR